MYVGISMVFNTLVSRLRERSFRESIGDGRTRGFSDGRFSGIFNRMNQSTGNRISSLESK